MDGIPAVGNYTIAFLSGLEPPVWAEFASYPILFGGDSMKIGIIGAGKVGFTLGKFFSQGGVRVTGYYSRDPDSAREAAAFTQSSFYGSLQPLIEDSDAIFITVPDKEITNKYICHCSGALSAAEAFPAIGETGRTASPSIRFFPSAASMMLTGN